MINTDEYIFNFGQYAFYSYREVLKIDPTYIYWCVSNLPDFQLDEGDYEDLERRLGWRD